MNNLLEMYKISGKSITEISRISGISAATVQRYINNLDNYKHVNSQTLETLTNTLQELVKIQTKSALENTDNITEVETAITENVSSKSIVINKDNRYPKRGEIWYTKNFYASGGETWGSRPCVVISSNKLNDCIDTVEVVYITSQARTELPVHTTIKTNKPLSIVINEKIYSISKDKLTNYMGKVTDIEMSLIEKAILTCLDIKITPTSNVKLNPDFLVLQTERNFYKQFYDDVMSVYRKKNE